MVTLGEEKDRRKKKPQDENIMVPLLYRVAITTYIKT